MKIRNGNPNSNVDCGLAHGEVTRREFNINKQKTEQLADILRLLQIRSKNYRFRGREVVDLWFLVPQQEGPELEHGNCATELYSPPFERIVVAVVSGENDSDCCDSLFHKKLMHYQIKKIDCCQSFGVPVLLLLWIRWNRNPHSQSVSRDS